jgi:hypothetical protein
MSFCFVEVQLNNICFKYSCIYADLMHRESCTFVPLNDTQYQCTVRFMNTKWKMYPNSGIALHCTNAIRWDNLDQWEHTLSTSVHMMSFPLRAAIIGIK